MHIPRLVFCEYSRRPVESKRSLSRGAQRAAIGFLANYGISPPLALSTPDTLAPSGQIIPSGAIRRRALFRWDDISYERQVWERQKKAPP